MDNTNLISKQTQPKGCVFISGGAKEFAAIYAELRRSDD